MHEIHSILLIAAVAAVTMALRFFPFFIFGGRRKTPAFITYLSGVLPYAIMGMLVVYCLRGVDIFSGSHGLPELLAGALVVAVHLWKKNTLLSITAGTIVYMVLIQMVF